MVQEPLGSQGRRSALCGKELTMLYHLLLYRSLTRTQRASAILDKGGVPNRILRVPREISQEGCGNGIHLEQGYLHRALTLLRASGAEPRKVFVSAGDDHYEEVLL